MSVSRQLAMWTRIVLRVLTVQEVFIREHFRKRAAEYIRHRMPTLGLLLTSQVRLDLEGEPVVPATAPACRAGKMAVCYPERPQRCEHPVSSAYLYGNGAGRFRECRTCGGRWAAREWKNPCTRSDEPVYDQLLEPRPAPGAKIPQASKVRASDSLDY